MRLNGFIETILADVAPWADGVGDDVDFVARHSADGGGAESHSE